MLLGALLLKESLLVFSFSVFFLRRVSSFDMLKLFVGIELFSLDMLKLPCLFGLKLSLLLSSIFLCGEMELAGFVDEGMAF